MKQSLKSDTLKYRQLLNQLSKKLSDNYDVAFYEAAEELNNAQTFSFKGKVSDLSGAFESINDLYFNRNLGAVVLASDGIFNKGINPVYAVSQSPYAVYTIAVGDTTTQRDQKLSGAFFNKIVYLNDNFNIKVDVESGFLSGKSSKLSIYQIGEQATLLQQKDISYNSDNFFQSLDFTLPASKTGIIHYRLTLSNLTGEVSFRNNIRDIFVEVLDGRQKILILGNSPHPDISAIKAAIESNKNYQVDIEYAANFTGSIKDYNLVILHQLPSAIQKIANVFRDIRDLKKSALFILGNQTSLADFSKVQNAVLVKATADKYNDITTSVNKDFPLFSLSGKTMETLTKLPPLSNYFGDYISNPSSRVLLYQKINSVTTDFPLLLVNETSEAKVGVLCGEGVWRWRLHDFQMNGNQNATHEVLQKTVQYLSVKSEKRPFKISTDKNIFQDNEAIIFDAQLYNANYELINQPEVDLVIKSETGKALNYKFNKTEAAYRLNIGFLPTGNYSYTATAKVGNGTLTAGGKLSVSPVQLEDVRTRADYQVLNQLATQHGGKMYTLADAENIANEINAANKLKPILLDTIQTESAINLKWIFLMIVLLLGTEWGIRKYLGGY